jgi:hypothetical protein
MVDEIKMEDTDQLLIISRQVLNNLFIVFQIFDQKRSLINIQSSMVELGLVCTRYHCSSNQYLEALH